MSAVSTAVAEAFRAARALNGVTVTYSRPSASQSVSLVAVPGESSVEIDQNGELYETVKARDFLILASELILGGSLTKPARFDTVTDSDSVVHNVLDVGGEAGWTWNDGTHVIIRVHTKKD